MSYIIMLAYEKKLSNLNFNNRKKQKKNLNLSLINMNERIRLLKPTSCRNRALFEPKKSILVATFIA